CSSKTLTPTAWFTTSIFQLTLHCVHTIAPLLSTHTFPHCFLQRLRVPPFFLHIDVTIPVAYAHQLSIDLYILSMFFSLY
uniref:Uncharacterized protein n=1 Tax=Urocitellus parryii TaxID=9999 RepID=A0A8D2IBK5_UROPR